MELRKITQEELNEILEKHKKWLNDEKDGERADLSNADLSNADLSNADLRNANLYSADLSNANLYSADLYSAKLNNLTTLYTKGLKAISVQVDTSRRNNLISYYPDLNIWTTGCFQGSLDDLKNQIEKTHKDNEFMMKRYARAIIYILNEYEEDKKREEE